MFGSQLSRQLWIEPLEGRLLLAADFNFATASATRYSTGNIGGYVAAGDLDGVDGTDLVVANDYRATAGRTSDLLLMMNNGQGVFSPRRIPLPNNSRPQAVHVTDVDGMHGPDLVVAAIGVRDAASGGQATSAGSVFVVLNNGNGTFGAPQGYSAGDGPIDVVAANLDGQGALDYVTANFRSNDVSVLLEQAGGVLKSSRLEAGTSPVAVAVATIDGDTHLDLAVANLGSNDISLFHGDGQGGFTAVARLTGLDRPSDLLLFDVDDDSDTDLVAANSGSGQVSIFLNDGLGSLQLHVEISVSGAQSLTSGDLNRDGLDDLLVTSAAAGAVSTLTNLGGGDFSVTDVTVLDGALCSGDPNRGNLLRVKCNPQNVVVAQLNADTDVDVAIADVANGISVHLSGQAATIGGRAFTDFNGNGDDENGGDAGLGGVIIELYRDNNGNGLLETNGDTLVGTRTTAAGTGAYSFAGNGPGTYFVREQVPAGSTQTAPANGTYTIFAQSGVNVTNRDFGNFTAASLVIDNTLHVAANSINNVLEVLANDPQVSNPPLTITATGSVPGAPALQGNVSIASGGTVILYTPRTGFVGTEQFTYKLSNGDETVVTVQVGNSPKDVNLRLETTDLNNDPISTIAAGSEFKLRAYVQDTRTSAPDPSRTGVFGIYFDLLYDSSLIATVNDPANRFGFTIGFAPPYDVNGLSANDSFLNIIDEIGAFQTGSEPLGSGEFLLTEITFLANAAGVAELVADPADLRPFHDVLLYEPPVVVALDRVNFGLASITVVGASPEGESRDVNRDGFVTSIDVLQVVNELNANGPHGVAGEGAGPLAAAQFDTNRDGFITPLDALFVINHINAKLFRAEGEGSDDARQVSLDFQPLFTRTNQPLPPASARRFVERLADRRAEAEPPRAGENDIVFATWPRLVNHGLALVEVGSLSASELSLLEFWRNLESTDELN